MSLWDFKIANNCTRKICFSGSKPALILFGILVCLRSFAWEIDFSRRQVDFKRISDSNRAPASVDGPVSLMPAEQEVPLMSFLGGQPSFAESSSDVVVLNTENGFIPAQLHLRKGKNYTIHVVNTHPREKNLSIVMDEFTVKEATLFGVEKSFSISPKVDGIFSFQCPETGKEGKIVVYSGDGASVRTPASK